MKWLEALKEWNAKKNKGVWKIPKKGTKEYDQVKKLMDKGKKKGGMACDVKCGDEMVETQAYGDGMKVKRGRKKKQLEENEQ
jgi:hypothetical protein